jgi:hypothetical protein
MDVTMDQPQLRQPTELFKSSMVVEVIGTGFGKPADVGCFTLRFPRIQKVHDDRTDKEILEFDELQEMARESITYADGNAQIEKNWLNRLHIAEPNHQYDDVDDSIVSPERSEPTEDSVDSSSSSGQCLPHSRLPFKNGNHSNDGGMINPYETSMRRTLSPDVRSLKRKILSASFTVSPSRAKHRKRAVTLT